MSQIQRVMADLGIESIPALSPQAKGRIERLWGTLQDRLTKEMRLEGISSLEEANLFLPNFTERYNSRFSKSPEDPNSAWVSLPADIDTSYYFAIRESRKVRSDHCISFSGLTLQLLPDPCSPSLVGESITVHTVPEGELFLYHGRQQLAYRPVSSTQVTAPKHSDKPARAPKPVDPGAAIRRRGWLFGTRGQEQLDQEQALAVR